MSDNLKGKVFYANDESIGLRNKLERMLSHVFDVNKHSNSTILRMGATVEYDMLEIMSVMDYHDVEKVKRKGICQ